MKHLIADVLVVLSFVYPGNGAVAGTTKGDFDVTYYRLDLRFLPEDKAIAGRVDLEALANDDIREVALDLADTLQVDTTFLDGRSTQFIRTGNKLILAAKPEIKSGSRFAVTVEYHGTPKRPGLVFTMHDNKPEIVSYGLPFTARLWWPCKDTPSDKADSADIFFTVPSDLVAVSNGTLVSKTTSNNGTATSHWRVSYPIYPDVISIAAADYARFSLPYRYGGGNELMNLEFYVFPEDIDKAKIDFDVLPQILRFYSGLFGEYPFITEKYGLVEFSIQSFREHQTIPSIGARMITGDHANEWVIAHDLAHQWFGNSVSLQSWKDIWLNEGFSSFASWLWLEHSKGTAALDSLLGETGNSPLNGPVLINDTTSFGKLFSEDTFVKGAWVLRMLQHVVGDECFFASIKSYLKEFRYKNCSTEEFEHVVERNYGRPLNWFFDEWLGGTGRPEYKSNWRTIEREGKTFADVHVSQVQDSTRLFTMPLDIELRCTGGKKILTVMNGKKETDYEFPVTEDLTTVAVDPGKWILKTPFNPK